MEVILNIVSYIWNIIVFGIVWGISYFISVFYLFNGVVPLLWIPYVAFKILKKEFKPIAILNCIIAPVIWNILLVVLLALAYKITFLAKLLFSDAGIIGAVFALIQTFFKIFSYQAREEFISGLKR